MARPAAGKVRPRRAAGMAGGREGFPITQMNPHNSLDTGWRDYLRPPRGASPVFYTRLAAPARRDGV
jgi:hypothetical protein